MRQNQLGGFSILILVALCASWGLQQVAIKVTVQDVSPVFQAAIRSIGATILVGLWVILRKRPLFNHDGTLWWGIIVGLLFTIEFLLIYWGLDYTNASRAVIFLYMAPFVVAIGSQVFVPTERMGALQFLGLGFAFLGVVIVFGESLSLPSREMLIGDCMMIGAAFMWGATTVTIKAGPLAKVSPSKTLLYQLSVSAVIFPFASILLNEPGVVSVTPMAIGSLLYQTVWVATVTYLAWFWFIKQYSAAKVSSFTFLTPLFGVIAGGVLLNEPLTPALLVAMVMVAIGVYLVNRQQKKPLPNPV